MIDLKNFEKWRTENGRDARTGMRLRRGKIKPCNVDPKDLIIMALKIAANCTSRDDLKPLYLDLADMIEGASTDGERQ